MNKSYFWGMPHTETEVNAFEAAVHERSTDVAAGKFAAVAVVDEALDRATRRSASLLQVDVLFAVVTMLLAYKGTSEMPALFLQLNRWAFIFSLAGGILLLTNLSLVWPRDATSTFGNYREAFLFTMNVYKGRAWRYTLALTLTFIAFALTLMSLSQL
jgi:hypothetical protein